MRRVLFASLLADMARPSGYRTRVLAQMETAQSAGWEPHLIALSPIAHVTRPSAHRVLHQELARRRLRGVLLPHLPTFQARWGTHTMLLLAGMSIAAAARALGVDVVHGENHLATAAALAGRPFFHKPVLFDAHAVFPEEVELLGHTVGWPPQRTVREMRVARAIERHCWVTADGVAAVSWTLMSHFSHTYGPVADRPQRRFPCAVTPSAFSDPAVRPRVRAALGLEDRQVLVYVGSLAPYQMAPEMIQLFGALHARTPQAFLLIVSQAAAQRWHALAREHGLPGDSYRVVTGRNEDVAQLTAAGDVGLMLRDESLVNAVAFPTKLGEYLAAGVPVLTSAATRDPAQLIAAQRVGFVAPHVSDLTAATVGEFLRHVCTNRHEWAERCQFTATRELAWPSYAAALTDDYEQLARRNAS